MNVRLDSEALALLNADPDFNKELAKSQPSASSVHVSNAGGDKKKPRKEPLSFVTAIEEVDAVGKSLAFEVDSVIKRDHPPALKPHVEGGAHSPFPYDPQAVDRINGDQMRRFLGALTSPDGLEQRSVPMSSLVAIQPRVSPEKVQDMRTNGFDKLPTVVRHQGRNLLVDGHHRATAAYLDGDKSLDCKFCHLNGEDDQTLAKDVAFSFAIRKADPDQQLIFGWASVVQKGDYLIVDKQGDMILPEDLEKAAYDFVLEARNHGTMHEVIGTGRLVESMVFTQEKQKALGIVIKDAESGDQVVGWWTGFKVDSPEVWKMHKEGKLPEFSIGGQSSQIEMT